MSQSEFQECFDFYDEALAYYTWPEVGLVTVISPQPVQHVPRNCPSATGNQTPGLIPGENHLGREWCFTRDVFPSHMEDISVIPSTKHRCQAWSNKLKIFSSSSKVVNVFTTFHRHIRVQWN